MSELYPAKYSESQTWDAVQCLMCPHQCSIAPSRMGKCGVRANRNGKLMVSCYGRVSDMRHLSAEDLPLFHFHPGSKWLWVASMGCTMSCPFCNEWKLSQVTGARTRYLEPAALVREADEAGAQGIFFGGNEPAVWHEYVVDVAEVAHARGLLVSVGSGGMWAPEPFSQVLEIADAVLLGFKGFNPDFWSRDCGGLLEQARLNLEMAVGRERHVEVSYLVIEGKTDSPEQVNGFMNWLAEISPAVPVHLIGYKPDFQWHHPATSVECLRGVAQRLSAQLPYVYGGEEQTGISRDTRCPSCKRVVITRSVVRGVVRNGLRKDVCAGCGARIPLIQAPDPTPAPKG